MKKNLYLKELFGNNIEHAEMRAIQQLRNGLNGIIDNSPIDALSDKNDTEILTSNDKYMANCTLFVTYFPCYDCARAIEAAGIKNIVYLYQHPKHREEDEETNEFLENHVTITQFPEELIEELSRRMTENGLAITFKGKEYTGDEVPYLLSRLNNGIMPTRTIYL